MPRAGAEVFKEEVIARAPERTGKLKKNVVVLTQRSRRRGEITSGVHIRGRNMRTGNSDNTMKASDPRNAFYWRFVEMGTVNMPPHPFVRPRSMFARAGDGGRDQTNEPKRLMRH